MPSTLLKKNLILLEAKDPGLAEKLKTARPAAGYAVLTAKSGAPTLVRAIPQGVRKTLHSSYDPVREAARFLDSCPLDTSLNFIVGGVGLGYHLLELVKRVPRQARIVILEKDAGILRLAFEQIDCAEVLNHPGVSIHVAIDAAGLKQALAEDKTSFAINGCVPVAFKPLVDIDRPYYESLNEAFQTLLREARVELKTQTAFAKIFFRNVLENVHSLLASPGVHSVKNALPGVPAVVVASGPCLDKNMSLLKHVMDRVLVISAATALKPLLHCGIAPDFVVAVDPDDTTIKAFDLDAPPEKTWLLFDPCIPAAVIESFGTRRLAFDSAVYPAQWVARHNGEKGALGKTLSVAHTGFLFARHLGCGPIILVGQDLAFAHNRMYCSDSFFAEELRDQISNKRYMNDLEKQSYAKYAESLVATRNIFGGATTTTVALDSYKNIFAEEIKAAGAVYNATEGGAAIPGAVNLCLREALFLYCGRDLQTRKKDFLKATQITGDADRLRSALEEKSAALKHLNRQLADLKIKYLPSSDMEETGRKGFVAEMESFYQTFLRDEETARLLQDYAYADFVLWNRENQGLLIKGDGDPENEKRRCERDCKFLEALLKATDSMGRAIDKTSQRLKRR
ncbi:MAG: motility associated factor glycosyltransferase family protein [Nitrospinales bacterium]